MEKIFLLFLLFIRILPENTHTCFTDKQISNTNCFTDIIKFDQKKYRAGHAVVTRNGELFIEYSLDEDSSERLFYGLKKNGRNYFSDNSYVKTVCTLFNDYIINWEEQKHNIETNIDINSIKPPTHNNSFDIGYEYIPDIITINLCKSSELYKAIFKILLANLKKGKDNKRCIYMNKSQVEKWNIIVKNIKIRTFNI